MASPTLKCDAKVDPLDWSSDVGDAETRVWHAIWRPQTNEIFSCAGRSVRRWQVIDSKLELIDSLPVKDRHKKTIRRLAFDHKGSTLACASFDGTVSIWKFDEDSSGWTFSHALQGHESEVKGVAFSPQPTENGGLIVATCGRDHTVWVHGEYKGDSVIEQQYYCVSVLSNHTQDVKCVTFHPTKPLLVSTSYDCTIRIYATGNKDDDDSDEWKQVQVLSHPAGTAWDAAFTQDGALLAVCSADGSVYVYRPGAHVSAQQVVMPRSALFNSAMQAAGGKWRAEWTLDSDIDLGAEICEQPIYSVDIIVVANYGAGVEYLATGCGDHSIRLFRRASGAARKEWEAMAAITNAHAGDVNSVRWCRPGDGKTLLLASAGDDGRVAVWTIPITQ